MSKSSSQNFRIALFFKGMAMGAADLIPGVSGGTIALVTGIYQELIFTINQLNLLNFKLLLKGQWKAFWKAINANFILLVFGGIFASIVSLSFSIDFLLREYPIHLNAFFLGLLLASIQMLIRQVKTPRNLHFWGFIALGFVLSFGLTQLAVGTSEPSLIKLFFSGMIAISAMLLPGLSGAYILLVLGVYDTFIATLKGLLTQLVDFEMTTFLLHAKNALCLGLGILIGIRLFAMLLKWVLKKYPDKTLLLLIGLICGALHKIWPWQKWMILGSDHKISLAVWPTRIEGETHIVAAVICLIFGFLILAILERQTQKTKNGKPQL
ncbi:MAG: DUF368 domain-containing protein [Flavobacteriaceae bacterium]